jgi:hypothetical protein
MQFKGDRLATEKVVISATLPPKPQTENDD